MWCLYWLVVFVDVLCWLVLVHAEGIVEVYVNRMKLEDVSWSGHSVSADYFYEDGDAIEVHCFGWNIQGTLRLTYEPGEQLLGTNETSVTGHTVEEGSVTLGMRTRLHAAHASGARLICHHINVTFIPLQAFDRTLELKVGAVPLRFKQPNLMRADSANTYDVIYAYKPSERFTWESHSDDPHAVVTNNVNSTHVSDTKIDVDPAENSELTYFIRSNNEDLRRIYVNFNKYLFRLLNDSSLSPSLSVDVDPRRASLELFTHAPHFSSRTVYHDYVDGEALSWNCTTLPGLVLRYNYTLVFGDTGTSCNDSIVTGVQLSAAHHNTTLNCSLINNRNKTIRQVTLLFRMTNGTAPDGEFGLLMTLAGSGVVFVAVVVVACVYYTRRRSHRAREKSDPGNLATPLYNNPRQQRNSQTRADEATYSEVLSQGPGISTHGTPTALITGKNGRNPELIYAVLDLAPAHQAPRRFHSEESPYAQVRLDTAPPQ